MGVRVIGECKRTILPEPGQAGLADFLPKHCHGCTAGQGNSRGSALGAESADQNLAHGSNA
jgi:hypothetical protein